MKANYIEIDKHHLIELSNDLGLTIYLSKYSASINAIYYKNKLMTVSPLQYEDFIKPNCLLGKTLDLAKEEKEKGLEYARFEVSNLYNKKGTALVIFKFKPLYDRNLFYQIAYSINNQSNELEISLNAMTNVDNYFSLAKHLVFSLGEDDVKKLTLNIADLNENINKHILLNNRDITLENSSVKIVLKSDYQSCFVETDNKGDDIKVQNGTAKKHRGVLLRLEDNPNKKDITLRGNIYSRTIRISFMDK